VDDNLGLLDSEDLAHLRRRRETVRKASATCAVAKKLGLGGSVGVDSVGSERAAGSTRGTAVDAGRGHTVDKGSIRSRVTGKDGLPLVIVAHERRVRRGGGRSWQQERKIRWQRSGKNK
jgi:hypothetical protein